MKDIYIEPFSGTCTDICDNVNNSEDVQIACDEGSQNYCKNVININSTECKNYLNRLSRTIKNEKINNPVKAVKNSSIQNYIQDLKNTIIEFGNIGSNFKTDNYNYLVQQCINANIPHRDFMTEEIGNKAITYCLNNPLDKEFCAVDNNLINNNSWLVNYMKIIAPELTKKINADLNKNGLDNVLNNLLDPKSNDILILIKIFPSLFEQLENDIISFVKPEDFTKKSIISLRNISSGLQNKLDTKILNYIASIKDGFKEKLENNNQDMHEIYQKIYADAYKNAYAEIMKITNNNIDSNQNLQINENTFNQMDKISSEIAVVEANKLLSEMPIEDKEMDIEKNKDITIDASEDEDFQRIIKYISNLGKKIKQAIELAKEANVSMTGATKNNFNARIKQDRVYLSTMKNTINKILKKLEVRIFPNEKIIYLAQLQSQATQLKQKLKEMQNAKMYSYLKIDISIPESYTNKYYNIKLSKILNKNLFNNKEKFAIEVDSIIQNAKIYNPIFIQYINNIIENKNLLQNNKEDSLLKFLYDIEDKITETCSQSDNIINNPLCISFVKNTINKKDFAKSQTVKFCSENILQPKCIEIINNNKKDFNMDEIYKSAVKACLLIDNDKLCKELPNIDGLKDFIMEVTKNKIIKNTNGEIIDIEPSCKDTKDAVFNIKECTDICKKYPYICQVDIINKCSLPLYRYNEQSIDKFSNKNLIYDNTYEFINIYSNKEIDEIDEIDKIFENNIKKYTKSCINTHIIIFTIIMIIFLIFTSILFINKITNNYTNNSLFIILSELKKSN